MKEINISQLSKKEKMESINEIKVLSKLKFVCFIDDN
jgi:hypothetical protein